MSLYEPYIPIDRRIALAKGENLPDRTEGTTLFADISGFTQLTARLAETLGRKRGAEEILPLLNRIYSDIVRTIQHYSGSVIHFSGDAVTSWFDADDGSKAVAAAVEMMQAMASFESVSVPGGFVASISMKVSIAKGAARRLQVGSPRHTLCDVLAGRIVDEVAQGERLAKRGEIILARNVVEGLGGKAVVSEWREGKDGLQFAVLAEFNAAVQPAPWPEVPPVSETDAAPYVLPLVAKRLQKGEGHYLAEIRPATAVFLQFSGLDYDRDDEAEEKLDRYVRWVQGVIEQYEGVLLQLTIGDKGAYFFLCFGAPVAHSDDVARAVASALLLRSVPPELGYIKNIKIGIAQGQMRTGAYGGSTRLAYGVLGEKVNRAARLMSYAPPDEIYCDDSVYVSIQNHWGTELVPLRVDREGPGETVPLGSVYRLTGETLTHPLRFGLNRRLVGRELELEKLGKILEETVSGRTGFAWLAGEAGIGKSHLVQEFASQAQMNGYFVLAGAGSSIEQKTAYWAWRGILSEYFGWDERRPAAENEELVESFAQKMAPEHVARLPVLNDIAYLGIPENDLTRNLPTALRLDNVVLLIAELLRLRAVAQPMLLILEDVHWMDNLSWELSLRVAKHMQEFNERVSVLWTTRPPADEKTAARAASAKKLANLDEMVLAQLPSGEIRQLVSMELGISTAKIPPELERFVQEKSEGNPFFARELVLTLKDRRLIWYLGAASETPWQVADDFYRAASTLPDTLHGLILARIDRLTLEQQTTLKVASVIGRSFKRSALQHSMQTFAESAAGGLDRELVVLVEAGLIQPEGEANYLFNHILTRDTTYQTLLFAQRRILHEVVAGWYETSYTGESLEPYFPILAYHYQNAEIPALEYGYVCKSADQAQKRYANREALDYLARALVLTESPEEQIRLRLKREEIYDLIGDRAAQAEELAGLDLLCRSHPLDSRLAELSMRYAQFQRLTGSYAEAMESADRVIGIGDRTGDRLILARGAHIRGQVLVQLGTYSEAAAYFEKALAAYLAEEADAAIAEVYGDYGILEVYQGDFRKAVPYFEQAIDIYRSFNNRREVARNQSNLAGAYGFLRDLGKAIETYKEAIETNREIGERRNAHVAQGNLGSAYLMCGEYNLALQHLNEALVTSRAIGDVRKEGSWLGMLGEVSLTVGRYGEAINYFHEALRISLDIGNKNGQGQWQNRLGDAYRLQGSRMQARSWTERGLAANDAIGNQGELASARQTLGLIFSEEGRWDKALEAFENAYLIRERLGQDVIRASLLPGIGNALLKQNQAPEASRRLESFWSIWKEYSDQQRLDTDLWALLTAHEVFDALGDQRAIPVLEAAYHSMMTRADRISDPEMRREFIEAVLINRTISARYQNHQAIVKVASVPAA